MQSVPTQRVRTRGKWLILRAVPENVSDEQAAFTIVGAIALQGVRLLLPTLGERVVVSGLGLIGLLAVQILRAPGCRVMGPDFDARKLALARQFGAETVDLSTGADPVAATQHWTDGVGVDAVLITASATGDELIRQVANMCRQRGRIVLVGVVGRVGRKKLRVASGELRERLAGGSLLAWIGWRCFCGGGWVYDADVDAAVA